MSRAPSIRSARVHLAHAIAAAICLLALAAPAPALAADAPPAPELERTIELDDVKYEGSNSITMDVSDDGAYALVRQHRSSGYYTENEGKYSLTVVNLNNGSQAQFIYDQNPDFAFTGNDTAVVVATDDNRTSATLQEINLATGTATELDASGVNEVLYPGFVFALKGAADGRIAILGIDDSGTFTLITYDIKNQEVTRRCSLDFTVDPAKQQLCTYWISDNLSYAYSFDYSSQLNAKGYADATSCSVQTIDIESERIVSAQSYTVSAVPFVLAPSIVTEFDNGMLLAFNSQGPQPLLIDPETRTIKPITEAQATLAGYNDTQVALLEGSHRASADYLTTGVSDGYFQQENISLFDTTTGELKRTNSLDANSSTEGFSATLCLSADGTYLYTVQRSGSVDVWARWARITVCDVSTGASSEAPEIEGNQTFYTPSSDMFLVNNDSTLVALISKPSEGPFSINVYATGIGTADPLSLFGGMGAAPVIIGAAGVAAVAVIGGIVFTMRRHGKTSATVQPATNLAPRSSEDAHHDIPDSDIAAHEDSKAPLQSKAQEPASARGNFPDASTANKAAASHDTPRFCSFCGSPLKPGAKFCATCGKPVAR